MNHLASHIEILLLENDCVVIPGFGGFIAHNTSALWNKEDNLFIPPSRTIGFNPQLKLNDGLLIQSYMNAYHIDYNEANNLVKEETQQLLNGLNEKGKVEFPFIGEISCTANDSYVFSPYNEKINTPSLYGLDDFSLKDWNSLINESQKQIVIPVPKRSYSIKPVWRNIAAVAAAIMIFFFMSTPIENTYVENQSYAHVFPSELFDKIKNESLITTQVGVSSKKQQAKSDTKTNQSVTPIVAKEVKVPKAETPVENKVQDQNYKYHLIVGSVNKESDATTMVDNLKAKGYAGAKVIKGDGRIRIGIASYPNRQEATKELAELRKIESYQTAWLLIK